MVDGIVSCHQPPRRYRIILSCVVWSHCVNVLISLEYQFSNPRVSRWFDGGCRRNQFGVLYKSWWSYCGILKIKCGERMKFSPTWSSWRAHDSVCRCDDAALSWSSCQDDSQSCLFYESNLKERRHMRPIWRTWTVMISSTEKLE